MLREIQVLLLIHVGLVINWRLSSTWCTLDLIFNCSKWREKSFVPVDTTCGNILWNIFTAGHANVSLCVLIAGLTKIMGWNCKVKLFTFFKKVKNSRKEIISQQFSLLLYRHRLTLKWKPAHSTVLRKELRQINVEWILFNENSFEFLNYKI